MYLKNNIISDVGKLHRKASLKSSGSEPLFNQRRYSAQWSLRFTRGPVELKVYLCTPILGRMTPIKPPPTSVSWQARLVSVKGVLQYRPNRVRYGTDRTDRYKLEPGPQALPKTRPWTPKAPKSKALI